tara:strand:- start:317 stop:787 length:471 start_codon:yes stop_codon:yes gene_type:complete
MRRDFDASRILKLLLRILGGAMILAVFAVVMPDSWLRLAVNEVEPGTRVYVLVEYLARGWSSFYFMTGCLVWLFSTDLPRYAPAGKLVGLCYVILAGGGTLFVTWLALTTPEWEKPWFFWIVLFNLGCGLGLGLPIYILYKITMNEGQTDSNDKTC